MNRTVCARSHVTAGLDDLSGNFDVVINRLGVAELASFPSLPGPLDQISSFPALAHLTCPAAARVRGPPGLIR